VARVAEFLEVDVLYHVDIGRNIKLELVQNGLAPFQKWEFDLVLVI